MSGIYEWSKDIQARIDRGDLEEALVKEATDALFDLVKNASMNNADIDYEKAKGCIDAGADINVHFDGYQAADDISRDMLEWMLREGSDLLKQLSRMLELGYVPDPALVHLSTVFDYESPAEDNAKFVHLMLQQGLGHVAGVKTYMGEGEFSIPESFGAKQDGPYYLLNQSRRVSHPSRKIPVCYVSGDSLEDVHSWQLDIGELFGNSDFLQRIKRNCDKTARRFLEQKKQDIPIDHISDRDLRKLHTGLWILEPEIKELLLKEPTALLARLDALPPLVKEGYMDALSHELVAGTVQHVIEGPAKDWSVIETSLQERGVL